MKPVANGNSNHLRDQTGARCAQKPGGSELWPGNFTKASVWFCRFAFEDLFLCLPMLSAPPVPTWLWVKAGWIQEELAGSRCPEAWDRKPINNSFLTSPCGKRSYFTKCFGNFAPGWKVFLAEWGPSTGRQPEWPECTARPGDPGQQHNLVFFRVSNAGHRGCGGEGALTEDQLCYSFPLPLLLLLCNLFRWFHPPFCNLKGLQGTGCLCKAVSVLGVHQEASFGVWKGTHQGGAPIQRPGSCELPPCPTSGFGLP